jgi:hypothetical protein
MLEPDKAVYISTCVKKCFVTKNLRLVNIFIALKPFGSEWRAATSSAIGEHHYGGEKKL